MPLYGYYESITPWIFQCLNQSVRGPRDHDQILSDTFYSLMMMAVHDHFARSRYFRQTASFAECHFV